MKHMPNSHLTADIITEGELGVKGGFEAAILANIASSLEHNGGTVTITAKAAAGFMRGRIMERTASDKYSDESAK